MSQPNPNLEAGLQIGDYMLVSQLELGPDRQVWLGEQVSVKREVEIICYYGPDPDGFLADIRVKAMVEDSIFGLVYEAVPTEEFIACAREALPEKSLFSISNGQQYLKPIEVTRIINQVAGALRNLDKRGIARNDFDGSDIRLAPDNSVRIRNLAIAGPQHDDSPSRQAFAGVLRPLLQIGEPGATRMGTLLDYIEGTENQEAIPWSQAEKLSQQVDEQLSASVIPSTRSTPIIESKKGYRGTMIAGLICGLIAIIIGFFVFQNDELTFETGLVITVPEGRYPRPNGGIVELKSFRIDATEVTIGEYADFMIAWQTMKPEARKKLFPSNVPDDKTNIRPAGWNTYFPLARGQKTWDGRKISLDCPVMGVDWWDARAFAKWQRGRLPTEQEWWAAVNSIKATSDKKSEWGPVGGPSEAIYGLHGNVSEWAGKFSKDPAFPIDSAKPVALGGSFLKTSKDALTREWLDSPSIRRADLGFRVVYPAEE